MSDFGTRWGRISSDSTPANSFIHATQWRWNTASNNDNTTNLVMDATPSFIEWIRISWQDLITTLLLGSACVIIHFADPVPSRYFPVYSRMGDIVYPQFAYPLRTNIVTIWVAIMMASIIPLLVILLIQIRIRSFWDANNAIWGLIYSLIIAGIFQGLLKWLIGGMGPNFLSVCDPIVPIHLSLKAKVVPMPIMYDRKVCTGDEKQINHSLESFPSGQSTVAFSGFVYLALYLNAKLKIWSNYHPAMWKMALFWAAILSATLISASLIINGFHNWYDCLAGGIIGTVMAFSAYRMVFASIWDYEYNHIPLNREISLRGKTLGLTATQKAGWGGGRHRRENSSRNSRVSEVAPRNLTIARTTRALDLTSVQASIPAATTSYRATQGSTETVILRRPSDTFEEIDNSESL